MKSSSNGEIELAAWPNIAISMLYHHVPRKSFDFMPGIPWPLGPWVVIIDYFQLVILKFLVEIAEALKGLYELYNSRSDQKTSQR